MLIPVILIYFTNISCFIMFGVSSLLGARISIKSNSSSSIVSLSDEKLRKNFKKINLDISHANIFPCCSFLLMKYQFQ